MGTDLSVTHGVCWCGPDARHDGDDDVLFDSERSRIKRDTKEGNLRHVTSPQLSHEKRQKERDELDVGGGA